MSRLEFEWPDEMVEQVRAARGRLERAGEVLREIPLEERIQAVARVLNAWTQPDSPWRRELAERFAEATPFHPLTVAEGLDSALRAWQPDRFVACARRELAGVIDLGSYALAPYSWTAVLAGGSIPMPTLLSSLLPLVLGSPVLLRESSKDPVTAELLARSLAEHDRNLARAFERLAIPKEDVAAFDRLLEAPCVVATGSDETIRSISSRLGASRRFVGYGHRFSIGVVGADALGPMKDAAHGFALDVARWDQSGCLSPVVIYLIGLDAESREEFASGLASALAELTDRMPRGSSSTADRAAVATERSEARMRAASQKATLFEAEDHTIVLEEDARPRPAPLHRFVRLLPVASTPALGDALRPFVGHLATAAIEGVSPRNRSELVRLLSRAGISRITSAGRMQTPPIDWPHDGLPLFAPMARFVQSD